jgi:hypothetical protein
MPGCTLLATPLVSLLDRYLEPHLDQMQHVPIDDPPYHRLHQLGVRDRVEVRGQIRVNNLRMPRCKQAVNLPDRIVRVPIRTVGVLLRWQVGLKDRA